MHLSKLQTNLNTGSGSYDSVAAFLADAELIAGNLPLPPSIPTASMLQPAIASAPQKTGLRL